MTKNNNVPGTTFKKGQFEAQVWENSTENGGSYRTIHVKKSYPVNGKLVSKDLYLSERNLEDLKRILSNISF